MKQVEMLDNVLITYANAAMRHRVSQVIFVICAVDVYVAS